MMFHISLFKKKTAAVVLLKNVNLHVDMCSVGMQCISMYAEMHKYVAWQQPQGVMMPPNFLSSHSCFCVLFSSFKPDEMQSTIRYLPTFIDNSGVVLCVNILPSAWRLLRLHGPKP